MYTVLVTAQGGANYRRESFQTRQEADAFYAQMVNGSWPFGTRVRMQKSA